MGKEKLLLLFCNYLDIQENLSEICYIIDDLRSAGATDDDLKELGYEWYLEMENEEAMS